MKIEDGEQQPNIAEYDEELARFRNDTLFDSMVYFIGYFAPPAVLFAGPRACRAELATSFAPCYARPFRDKREVLDRRVTTPARQVSLYGWAIYTDVDFQQRVA